MGGRYVRRIDYHKLEIEKEVEGYTYFFRHCWSTRLCVKLLEKGGNKVLLYGYNGMGLHKSHPSWRSLVVRSRSAGLTARLVSVLGAPCRQKHFIDGVPDGCARSFEECMDIISSCLEARGVERPGGPRPQTPTAMEATATDGGEESEGGGLDGGEPDEVPVWDDEN